MSWSGVSDDEILYRPPAPLAPRRSIFKRLPPWGWAFLLLAVSVLLQLSAAAFLILAFGPKAEDSPPQCQSNIRQVCRAIALYAQDYDGRFPPAAAWVDSTSPMAQSETAYHCPNFRSGDIFAFGYAFNRTLGQAHRSNLTAPTQTAMVYDSTKVKRNANDAVTSLPDPPRHRSFVQIANSNVWGNNIGYVDGHAAFVPNTASR